MKCVVEMVLFVIGEKYKVFMFSIYKYKYFFFCIVRLVFSWYFVILLRLEWVSYVRELVRIVIVKGI